jgi:hypothetical protein
MSRGAEAMKHELSAHVTVQIHGEARHCAGGGICRRHELFADRKSAPASAGEAWRALLVRPGGGSLLVAEPHCMAIP